MSPKDRIIVALDVESYQEAKKLLKTLKNSVSCFKIGLELLTRVGPDVISLVQYHGADVFYDGKFCDIPNTVAGASKGVAQMGVQMFNVHASCGQKSIEAAVANRGESSVLGVTVLTSINPDECLSIFGDTPGNKVLQFSSMLLKAGAQGIVCSPKELELLGKHREFDKLLKVIPGIRPSWAPPDDQKRFATPGEAVKLGATFLVIGRSITDPPPEIGGPIQAVNLIITEISEAQEQQLS